MSDKIILHILTPDKFTIPLIKLLNKELSTYNHVFLCVAKFDDNPIYDLPNVIVLKSPHRWHLLSNLKTTFQYIRAASKVILHGNPIFYLLFLLYYFLPPLYWVIYGGADMGTIEQNSHCNINIWIKKTILKKVVGHISHIKEDSVLANEIFKSNAVFYYNPMYLSNVFDFKNNHHVQNSNRDSIKKILVGNSTEQRNNHFEIFEILLPYKNKNIQLYCPLSYGIYQEYRDAVIERGKAIFGDQFIPLTEFMEIKEYQNFLNTIDIAIFNHKEQAAMGVTISLLAQNKIIYMCPEPTSYVSLTSRGFQVYDIDLIKKGELFLDRDISQNKDKVAMYYSSVTLINAWIHLYKMN